MEFPARMSSRERRLAAELSGGQEARLLVCTGTRVDVGQWLRRGRVWAAALADEMLLFASGRRPHCERVPLGRLGESVYNPVTGELVLAPAQGVRARNLRMPPLDGYRFLSLLRREEPGHAASAV